MNILALWAPIIAVVLGAFIALAISLEEKNRRRKNLKSTVVLWLCESIKAIEEFIGALQKYVEKSKSAQALGPQQLFIPTFDLEWIKQFPIDKMSDALVARLKVGKTERQKLIENFYDLYDFTNSFTATREQISEAHSDYNRKMEYLQHEWDNCHGEFWHLIKTCLVSSDLSEYEREIFIRIDSILDDFNQRVIAVEGIFRRDILQDVVLDISNILAGTYATERLNEVVESFHKVHVVPHHMESLHASMIQDMQTFHEILSPCKEELARLISFYGQHKIKGIRSLSNKVA